MSCVVVLAGLLAIPAAALQGPETATVSVWDGVYTAEQASRGRAHFETHCTGCHGAGGNATALDGNNFYQHWGEDSLLSLFNRIRNTMPARDPGSLSEDEYLEIVTYLLEMNGFPAGNSELVPAAVEAVRVERVDGPAEVPDFSLVAVSGCLSRTDGGNWIVSSATAPVRTRDPGESTAEALLALATSPIGDETFELVYVFPQPDDLVGHRIEAKGFLIRNPDPDQINVSSISDVQSTCP